MEHFYKNVTGYVNDGDLEALRKGVENTPDGGTIIEVGICNGYCTAFLIAEIANSGKKIKLISCDTFPDQAHMNWVLNFLDSYDVDIRQCRSVDLIVDKADFVWLDGDHTYQNVKAELEKFYPIVPVGGMIAGHDYLHPSYPEVRQAVDEFAAANGIEVKTEDWSFYFVKQ